MDNVSENDILAAIEAAINRPVEGRPDGYKTVYEIVQETGIGRDRVRDELRRLDKLGKLRVIRVQAKGIDGRYYHAPAYGIGEQQRGYLD